MKLGIHRWRKPVLLVVGTIVAGGYTFPADAANWLNRVAL